MPSLGRKWITVACGSVAALVILLAGAALWPILEEEWHLRAFERDHEPRIQAAAEWLGQHGTVRTLGRLFDVARRLVSSADAGDPSSVRCKAVNMTFEASEKIVLRRRAECVPLLVTILKEPPQQPNWGQMRIGAVMLLERLGPEGRIAIPALIEALSDEDRGFRNEVTQAL